LTMAVHMVIAAFAATGFAVAGVHAWRLRQRPGDRFHQVALKMALTMGVIAAVVQPLSGDRSAKDVAQRQPAKFAAMEAHYHTQAQAGLLIGGIPDDETKTVHYGIYLPKMLSFLAHGDLDATVVGLDRIPADQRPPTMVTHFAFQIMVFSGFAMIAVGLFFFTASRWRPQWVDHPRMLGLVVACTPLGFVAVEAGWTVTEVGRQPWIIYGVMRTADALSPMPGLQWSFAITTATYVGLAVLTAAVLRRQILHLEDARS